MLTTFFSLVCIPTIHAVAIHASTAPNAPSLDLVARSWIAALIGTSSDEEGLSVSATATDATAYLRVASLSIALYE